MFLARMINAAMTGLFDLLLWPLAKVDPIWALLGVSFVAGIAMLWLFGKTSNQERIKKVRDYARGNMMAIRLYGDDLGLLFRLQGRILRSTGTYLWLALKPMLVMLVPVLLLLAQLNLRFHVRPLSPGDSTMVKVTLREGPAVGAPVELEAPAGVVVETAGVRIDALREIAWRVRGDAPGVHTLIVRSGDERLEKELVVGGRWAAVSEKRTGQSFFESILYPGEPPVDGTSAIRDVEVRYAELPLALFGFRLNWLVVFFVASLAFGYAFRRPLGVEL